MRIQQWRRVGDRQISDPQLTSGVGTVEHRGANQPSSTEETCRGSNAGGTGQHSTTRGTAVHCAAASIG
ncbi:Uncharacterised protein [Mycobacteroides abscessus subsp. abscessus]|nr:Uncharacterised protein [Mycobacteroides abscessus subsp. abscessus]